MRADNDPAPTPPAASRDAAPEKWLTDVIDQLDRRAFQRSLERRHGSSAYGTVIEAARLARTTAS